MIIHHSLELLIQLHELETKLHQWEKWAKEQGVQLDSESLLKLTLLLRERQKTS